MGRLEGWHAAGVWREEASDAGRGFAVQEDGLESVARAARIGCYVRRILQGE